ncbi:DUF2515 family protein [Gracilibacillus kekensis]|uniref:DUF2515 domain-containing protein n=1 Tax=Gracilibacillus kekensis TaxID=1027249 RepID=A0A1M7P2K8_9BACI|nr:DUF2515 family protein [Gracilibacillus kekensis]SHN10771.1 Protein of unknown function [Gracilibacillus kekensis]
MLHQKQNNPSYSSSERNVIKTIHQETIKHNRNNITRTAAYLEIYKQFPEIEWAFLAHMVSRNAGWNMTDLKGGLLGKILSVEDAKRFFAFLERGNWLIFQDAYPQLLLFKESVRNGQNLFHLLPALDVSYFMEVVWNYFYQKKDRHLLTTALIINEQSYIEKRVIQHSDYQLEIFKSVKFKIQEILQLNHILLPFKADHEVKLIGQSVLHFASLDDRIQLGKRLYHLLFDQQYYILIFNWAKKQRHTGSRADFWPNMFQTINENTPGKVTNASLEGCTIKPNSPRIYSPTLIDSWPNSKQKIAEKGDWYTHDKIVLYLKKEKLQVNGDIMTDYCHSLERLQLAAIAKEGLS